MTFAYHPDYLPDIENPRTYDTFRFFNFAWTQRSWVEEPMEGVWESQQFLEDLKQVEAEWEGAIPYLTMYRFSFLLDTSVLAEQIRPSTKKLDDFFDLLGEKSEVTRKQQSKMRFYAEKPENFGYVLRWGKQHPEHPLAEEAEQVVTEALERIKKAIDKKFPGEDINEENSDRIGLLYSRWEEENITKFMTYSYHSPEMFYFNAYIVGLWFLKYEEIYEMMKNSHIVTQFRRQKKIVSDVYQGTEFDKSCLVMEELMGNFLPLLNSDELYGTGTFLYLDDYGPDMEEDVDRTLLQTVGGWAARRINEKGGYHLPKERWFADVDWKVLLDMGVKQMSIVSEKPAYKEAGVKERLVHAKANIGEGLYLLFPLIDPVYWKDFTDKQVALQVYALCMYHDISVEQAFTVEAGGKVENVPFYVEKPGEAKFEGTKLVSRAGVSEKKRERSAGKKHKPHREHWVTFHLRRLTKGREASSEVKERAMEKYGLEIPPGFTFIDAHVRGGEQAEDKGEVKVSALDIFGRVATK